MSHRKASLISLLTLVVVALCLLSIGQAPSARAVNTGAFAADSLALGFNHSCALVNVSDTAFSQVKCWGDGGIDEVGVATSGDISTAPGDVCNAPGDGNPGFGKISTGTTQVWQCRNPLRPGVSGVSLTAGQAAYHTCIVTTSGSVKCWGYNNEHQLGDSTQTNSRTPVDVQGLGGTVTAVTLGYEHTCALMQDSTVKCWGENSYGQLGDGQACGTDSCASPVTVCKTFVPGTGCTESLSGVTQITAGYEHTCAVVSGGAMCWGRNISGELGVADSNPHSTPVQVQSLTSGVAFIAAGGFNPLSGHSHTCALLTNGNVDCWGNNLYGQLGIGSFGGVYSTPQQVQGVSNAAAMTVGSFHGCVLMPSQSTNYALKCWGYNNYGTLGDGTTTSRSSAVPVQGLSSNVVEVRGGYFHTCARLTDGAVKCWGFNLYGQVGNGKTANVSTPQDVLLDSDRDGCTDNQEAANGSNPNVFWDFFDTPDSSSYGVRDRVINNDDQTRVSGRYGTSGSATVDPLDKPGASGYHPAFDRKYTGAGIWNVGPADGVIGSFDTILVQRQIGKSCQ